MKNGLYIWMIFDFKGVDLNDVFCIVFYEKGFILLFYLEILFGGLGEDVVFFIVSL